MDLHPLLRWRALTPQDATTLLALENAIEEAADLP